MPGNERQEVVFRRIGGRIVPIRKSKYNDYKFHERRRKIGKMAETASHVAGGLSVASGTAFGIMTASGNRFTTLMGKVIARTNVKKVKPIFSAQKGGSFLIREAKQLRKVRLVKGFGLKAAFIAAGLNAASALIAPDSQIEEAKEAFK